MSEDNNNEEHREIVPAEPQPAEIIPSPQSPNLAQLGPALLGAVEEVMSRTGVTLASFPRDVTYEELPEAERKIVDGVMELLVPEIEEKAKILLTEEIRDRLVRKASLVDMAKLLKKGKKPRIKRKKGCIFIQFGTGEPKDPIEEFLVAST